MQISKKWWIFTLDTLAYELTEWQFKNLIIIDSTSEQYNTCMYFFDLSKVFDTILHDIIKMSLNIKIVFQVISRRRTPSSVEKLILFEENFRHCSHHSLWRRQHLRVNLANKRNWIFLTWPNRTFGFINKRSGNEISSIADHVAVLLGLINGGTFI